jgi:predicted O-methyltransferase YrrM
VKTKCLAIILSCAFLQGYSEVPEPYCSLKEILPYDESGWYINAAPMEKILKENNVKVVIELGSWLGQSTRHIAQNLPQGGIIFAVDHWLGSAEIQLSLSHLLPFLYDQFLSNVIHTHLTDKIIPVKMTTLEAAEEFKVRQILPDLVYVDASHDEISVYADLEAYYPLVRGHGILCGDDWGWGGEASGLPVRKAVERFARENHLTIVVTNGWFWRLCE